MLSSENVTSAGWQVAPCDPIWHVNFRTGEGKLLQTALLRLRYLLYFVVWLEDDILVDFVKLTVCFAVLKPQSVFTTIIQVVLLVQMIGLDPVFRYVKGRCHGNQIIMGEVMNVDWYYFHSLH